MITKNKIAEQIQRLYSRFKAERENTKPVFDLRELYLLIDQSINSVVSLKTMESFSEGRIDIPASSVILYEGEAVVSDGDTSYVDLPIYPIRLPLEMGIWEITPADDPFNVFVPLPRETASLMGGTIIGALEQLTGFYLEAKNRVRFTKDITQVANGGVASVDIRLLVSDLSALAVTDTLPLNANYEILVIQDVLQTIGYGRIAQNELQAQLANDNTDA